MTNVLLVSALCALLAQGCSLFDSGPDGGAKDVKVIDDLRSFDRDMIETAHFEIEDVDIGGDLLRLRVLYRGGCERHAFELYSTRGIYQSYPPQADVYLSHDDGGDACRRLVREELAFDLSPLKDLSDPGALLLRLHPYQETEPIQPLPLYRY